MLGFSPFKKHANKFNYIPRYYDPEEERRAQRRAELRGERPEDAGREYVPGQYVRTARTARAARREAERSTRSKRRFGVLLTGIVVLLLFFVVIYPKLTSMMRRGVAPAVPAAVESRLPPPTSTSRASATWSGSRCRSRWYLTTTRGDRSVWPTESNSCPTS